jgi:hypothetical protein
MSSPAPKILESNVSSHGFVLSIFPLVNCLGVQGFIAPNTALGRAQFRMGIAQVVSIVIWAIGAILIAVSGEKNDKQGKPDPDNAKTPGAAKAGNWLLGIGVAALGVTTFMSMLTGITIGAQGNYGRK